MRPRFLLVVGEETPGRAHLVERLVGQTGFTLAFTHPRLAALVNADCSCLAAGEGSCIIGTLFRRHGRAEQLASLDEADIAAVAFGEGDVLLQSFWGGYVAAVSGSRSVRILRDPSAAISCYFVEAQGCTIFASDAALLVETGLVSISIDWHELGRHFARAGVPAPATCLSGVSELLPGFAIRVPGEAGRQLPCWSPWDHAERLDSRPDPPAERLARTIKQCVGAWAPNGRRLLVSVSGGLDSSVVAASLAAAGAEAVCLTMFGEDPAGDERPFARTLCQHLGFRLIERPYCLDRIDISEPLGTHLPRPQDRTHSLEYERAHLEVADEIGADAFMTGNGGDSVFAYSQSAAAIADRYFAEGLGSGLFETLMDVCRQTGCNMADALAAAWRIGRRGRSYRCRPNLLFLDAGIFEALPANLLDHPWLDAPAGALPGKAAHIASVLRLLQAMEPSRARYLAAFNPLMSQPIVEQCLAIPSWEWRAGGRDRALARLAFAKDLPAAILSRRVKGGPSQFAAQLLDRFRPAIRERLLGGRLASHGIIDAKAVDAALREERRCSGEERVRILEFVAAEAWLDSWIARA